MRPQSIAALICVAALSSTALAGPMGTSFTYQGQLMSAGKPVDAPIDVTFVLYDAATDGTALGTQALTGVPVTNGLFTVALDFGVAAFDGNGRWLEITVNSQVLSPRQPVTATPYALYAAASPGSDFWVNGTNADDIAFGKLGRIGIGTLTPAEKLHVAGSVRAEGANGFMAMDPNNDAASVRLSWLNDVPRIRWGGSGVGSGNGFDFQRTGDVSLMRIMNDGKVGIGTTAPASTLDVVGTVQIGGTDFVPRLTLLHGADVEPASGGILVIGDAAGENIAIDTNEIMARNNGVVSTLLLNHDGGSVIVGTASTPLATLHVRGTSGIDNAGVEDYDYVAMFENPSDEDADGIAIWIHNSHTRALNNFVTFLDSSKNIVGRIEGFDLEAGDWEPPPVLDDLDVQFDMDFHKGSSPSLHINFLSQDYDWDNGSLPYFDTPPIKFTGMPTQSKWEQLILWAMKNNLQSFLATDPVALASLSLKIAAMQEMQDEGVVYGSKGADYAEWMPKLNATDRFQMGQIVGVRGGRVSLETDGAEQIMAVSLKPVVLGNQPPAGEADAYVKCAFMGQVKVVVRGGAKAGDFILASGRNDGTGVAVSADELKLDQVNRILGRAWSDSANELIGLVNVSVGLSTREWAGLMVQQDEAIRASAVDGQELHGRVDELQATIAAQGQALEANRVENESLRSRLDRLEALLAGNGASD